MTVWMYPRQQIEHNLKQQPVAYMVFIVPILSLDNHALQIIAIASNVKSMVVKT